MISISFLYKFFHLGIPDLLSSTLLSLFYTFGRDESKHLEFYYFGIESDSFDSWLGLPVP